MPLPATGESLYAVAKGSSLTYLQKRCNMRPAVPPGDMEKLKEPAFLRYLKSETRGNPITPDDEDFDLTVSAHTEAEQEHQYRQAQARKMLRLYSEWKAKQK